MPELPEVETIKRGLTGYILGQKIRKIEVRCDKSFIGVPCCGKVREIRRFGKALVVDLDNGKSMMIHLRMTGQLIFDGEERFAAGHPSESFVDNLPNKQTRVILYFENGVLYFNDQRKFGFIKVLDADAVEDDEFIRRLGPEPWVMSDDEFYERLMRHKAAPIKAVLLDQAVVAGLGNIYADEALFAAGIYPGRRTGNVSREEAAQLLTAAREVMERSIDSGGSTMATYVRADGTRGDYLEKFAQVFRREGQACPRCGTEILKTRVAGRGTHYCPKCQRVSDEEATV